MNKKFLSAIVLIVTAATLLVGFAACQAQFKLDFVVDGEIYHTIDTGGEEAVTLPDDPTKDGYVFDGWYWDKDIWSRPFTAESLLTVKLTGNMTVYAKWINEDVTKRDYKVVFDTMGYGEVETQSVPYGTLAVKPVAPERPGYALVGWYREADLTTVWNFRADTVTEDVTLYAKWVPSSDAAGCAIIDSGEMTMDGKTLTIELPNAQTTFAFGEQLTVSPYAQYEVSTDIAGKDVIPSATVELEVGDNVFYIQTVSGTGSNRDQYKAVVRRREVYTVTYSFGGGIADVTEQVEEDALAPFKDASRDGYTFTGWSSNGKAWDFESDRVTGDVTLTAGWSANSYRVSFDGAGGSAVDEAQVTFGEEFSLEVPTRVGYTFVGWKTADGVAVTDGRGVGTGEWGIAEDVVLTAAWTVNAYNIEYKNMDGAVNAASNPSRYTIEDDDIVLGEPSKTGYTFVGWTADEAGEDAVTEIDTSACEDVVLWAQWEINTYTATFVADDGTVEEVEFTVEDDSLTEPVVPAKVGYTGKWEDYDIVADDITVEAVYTPIVYNITYGGLEDGEHSNTEEYTIESATITLQDASRVGYDFVGWYDGEQEVTEIAQGSHGDITLTAKWEAIVYNITYAGLEDGEHSNADEYTIESATITLQDASRVGYDFVGWYDGEREVTEIAQGSHGDITLTAKWEAIVYGITYENLKGASMPSKTTYTIEDKTFVLQSLSGVVGYDFVGWYDGEREVTEIAQGSHGEITLTAKWEAIVYNIIYEYDDTIGDVAEGDSLKESYTIEDDFDFVTLECFTEGYHFDGWYTQKDLGTGEQVTGVDLGTIGDITVYAHWGLEVYDITYVGADGVTSTNPGNYTIESETSTISDLTKVGYTFDGWFEDEACEVAADTTVETGSTGDLVFYASWTPIEYTITYNLYGGGWDGEPNSGSYTIETGAELADPVLEGSFFVGWYDSAEGGALVTSIEVGEIGNRTLYARWLTFDSEGGSEVTGGVSYSASGVTEPEAPSLDWYDFGGWYLDETYEERYDFALPEVSMTVHALWIPIEYEIEYVLGGGENSPSNPATYNVEDSVVFEDAYREGYTFNGWYGNAEFTTEQVTGVEVGSHGKVTVYASFSINQYTISFETDGGTTVSEITQDYGTAIAAPAQPAKTGYAFVGWYESDPQELYDFTTMPARDFTLYAAWELVTYDIVYNLDGGVNNSNPSGYTIESETITLADATKRGYEFLGWFSDSGLGTPVSEIETGSYGDVELFAGWRVIEYEIVYHLPDGATHSNPDFYTVETDGTVFADGVMTGYTFDGWFSDEDLSQSVTSYGGGAIGGIELWAGFTANEYTVWLDGKEQAAYTIDFDLGGAGGSAPAQVVTAENGLTMPETPEWEGHIFAGWYDDAECDGLPYDFSGTVTSSRTLYAKWIVPQGTPVAVGGSYVATIAGTAMHRISFVPLVSGNVTLTAVGGIDTIAWLYDSEGTLLKANDDGGADGSNFLIVYNVTAGQEYVLEFRGYSRAASGTATVTVAGRTAVPDGGTASDVSGSKVVTFDGEFTLPVPAERDNWIFRGWADEDGVMYTDASGTGVRVWDKAEETVLVSVWEADGFTVSFVTGAGSAVDDVVLPYGARLDVNEYVTVREGYSFLGWYESASASDPYDASTMPDRDVTLYAKWTAYNLDNIKYDEAIKAASSLRTPTTEDFGATCFDTDGRQVEVTVTASGELVAGTTVTLRLTAASGGKTRTATIRDVKVYGAPTLEVTDRKDYFNLEDGLTAEWFGASGSDTFGEPAAIEVYVEGAYEAGDVVTVVIDSVDPAGNVTSESVENVRVYGAPTIDYDIAAAGISAFYDGSVPALGATAEDSFGQQLEVETGLSASLTPGQTVDVTFTATDSKGNAAALTVEGVKVYGAPSVGDIVKDDFKVGDVITVETMGANAADTFGEAASVTVEAVEGTQFAGETMTWRVSATDAVGNTTERDFTVWIYGDVTIEAADDAFSNSFEPTPDTLGVTAKDSFGSSLEVTLELVEGELVGGDEVTYAATATDAAGNVATETFTFRVYDADDIELTYDAFSTNIIKLSSAGEEFSASATDSFGEECAITVERADGGALVAGEVQSVVVVATDAVGNRKVGEPIASISVYDLPTIEYVRDQWYVEDGEDVTFNFTAYDSFGYEVYASVNVEEETDDYIYVLVTATDDAGNTATWEGQLRIVPAGGAWLVLYVGDEYIGDTVVEYGENYHLPIAGGGYGYEWSLDGVKLTDAQGNSLAPWDRTSNKYTLTASEPILITYTVDYVLDGGANAAGNPTSYTVLTLGGADGSVALADPSKVGEILDYTANGDGSFEVTKNVYTFLGWYKDAEFGQQVTSLTLDLGDATLYAKWSDPTVQKETKQYMRVNENNESDADGRYILFGQYPQTIKSADVTVGDVADGDGYYLGSDGERYAKVVADPYGSGYTFSDGSSVTDGATYYFKVEPIRWRILSEDGGSAFILADGILANKVYDTGGSSSNNYKNSDIRAWLNGEFLNVAFGEVAQSLIETTEVDNSASSTGDSSNQYACENTFDKVFLLSSREATDSAYGFASSSSTSDTARCMTVSDYARSAGAYMDTSSSYFGCGRWWLRSPYSHSSYDARNVIYRGSADYYSLVGYDYLGVVPALNIIL